MPRYVVETGCSSFGCHFARSSAVIRPPWASTSAANSFAQLALVEQIVGGEDRLLAALARGERGRLRRDQSAQGPRQVGLAEDLPGNRRRAVVGQEDRAREGPLLDLGPEVVDRPHQLGLDRIAVGHLDRRGQDLGERQPAPLGEHDQEAARGPRRHRGQRAVLRWIAQALRAEEFRRRAARRHAQRVDADDLTRLRVPDQRLGLAAPAQRVPHRAGGRQHRAGGVHRVAAALEDPRPGGRRQRLTGDRQPLVRVELGLLGAHRRRFARPQRQTGQDERRSRRHRQPEIPHRASLHANLPAPSLARCAGRRAGAPEAATWGAQLRLRPPRIPERSRK